MLSIGVIQSGAITKTSRAFKKSNGIAKPPVGAVDEEEQIIVARTRQ